MEEEEEPQESYCTTADGRNTPSTGSSDASSSSADEEECSSSAAAQSTTERDSRQFTVTEHDPICIVGEIVGGYHLPIDDPHGEFYAYVLVRYDDQYVHVTKAAMEPGRNPVWTINRGSLFFLETTANELSRKDLKFSVWFKRKDPLRLATLERLLVGQVIVDCSTLILNNMNERLLEVDLKDEDGVQIEGTFLGKLTLRFRLATPSDQDFVEAFLKQSNSGAKTRPSDHTRYFLQEQFARPIAPLVTETDEAKVAGVTFVRALSNAFSARNIYEKGQQKVRVKPHPDKDNPETTLYMTPDSLRTETLAPSKEWIEAGSGSFAKLYLEILSCHDLPNVDVGEAMGNMTDCFVCAVFEDSMVQTPVIDDELSPHFLPWTQRAFVFNCMHPASILYLGAFDYDLGLSNHEALGRVGVNISNLQRDTEYVLMYQMYNSSNVMDRRPSGSIRIRLRIEYTDERKVMLAALGPRPKFHVNVFKEKSLSVVRYTCFGEYGDDNNGEKFDVTVMRSYVSEILEYKNALMYCISDALRSLVFWRGQVKVSDNLHLPLHSFLLFCSCALLVERPYLLPSFLILSVAWIMLATHTIRRQHPSPWHRCPSFLRYVDILRFGHSSLFLQKISPHEGEAEAVAYEEAWTQRLEKDQKFAATKAQLMQEMNDFGNENIHTKQGDLIPLDLLAKLSYYQGWLGQYCKSIRYIKIIATWEESIVSFWLTGVFLLAGIISLFLPWASILRWTGRLAVWGLLGPHMKLVDAFLQSDHSNDEKVIASLIDSYKKESQLVRHRHQRAANLKDLKETIFGKYSTLIPSYNLSRHCDRPLPTSYARLHKSSVAITMADACIPGQQFFGEMVPRPQPAAEDYDRQLPALQSILEFVQAHVKKSAHSERHMLLDHQESMDQEKTNIPQSIGVKMIQRPEWSKCHTNRQSSSALEAAFKRENSRKTAVLSMNLNACSSRRVVANHESGIERNHKTDSIHNSCTDGNMRQSYGHRAPKDTYLNFFSSFFEPAQERQQRTSTIPNDKQQVKFDLLNQVEATSDGIEVVLSSDSHDDENLCGDAANVDDDHPSTWGVGDSMIYFRPNKYKVE
jgi:hypothetical protein